VDEDPAMFTHMMEITGRRTIPQIFIDDYHVGGFDDLSALNQSGKLDKLLNP
jgi:glutaredoxin 3